MATPFDFGTNRTLDLPSGATLIAEAGTGTAGGPPIVFLHGNPDTHTIWKPIVDRLSPAHRCVAPDLPGFGASERKPAHTYDLPSYARFVLELLDALALAKAHLVIHDVGGTYGLAFASLHPERLASLTICNTVFSPEYRWHFWARVWRRRVLGEIVMLTGFRALFVSETLKGSPGMTREYASHAWDGFRLKNRFHVLRWYRAGNPETLEGWDVKLRAATASVPKRVLWGDRDPYIQPRFADDFGAPARHFPEGGHWVMLDAPDEVAKEIAQLVASAANAR